MRNNWNFVFAFYGGSNSYRSGSSTNINLLEKSLFVLFKNNFAPMGCDIDIFWIPSPFSGGKSSKEKAVDGELVILSTILIQSGKKMI
jgi:hypothetical protein